MKVELVTNLKRKATKILADLHASKEPVLITEHGQPSACVVDVQDYELTQRRLELLGKWWSPMPDPVPRKRNPRMDPLRDAGRA